jgi:hypothetical protein
MGEFVGPNERKDALAEKIRQTLFFTRAFRGGMHLKSLESLQWSGFVSITGDRAASNPI